MKRDVYTVKPDDSVMKAVKLMNRHHVGSVIVAKDWNALGIITERDVLKKVVAKKKDATRVLCGKIMAKPVICIESKKDVAEAVKLMVKKSIKKLAVTKNGRMIGIITATDILRSGHDVQGAVLQELAKFFPLEKSGYGE